MKNGKIVIKFHKGAADNPKINAIVLVEGGEENTHKQQHDAYLTEIRRYYKEIIKTQQEQYTEMGGDDEGAFNLGGSLYDDDDEYPKTFLSEFLKQRFGLELTSAGFLLVFFSVLKMM